MEPLGVPTCLRRSGFLGSTEAEFDPTQSAKRFGCVLDPGQDNPRENPDFAVSWRRPGDQDRNPH